MKFEFEFIGRKKGAVGVSSSFCEVREGKNEHDAALALYDTHEHIRIICVTEVPDLNKEK